MMPLWGCFALLAGGILAIYLEIFVPAGGLIGLAGAGMIVAGVALGYVYHDPVDGTIVLFTALVVTPTAVVLGLKAFPHTPMGKRMILGMPLGSGDTAEENNRSAGPTNEPAGIRMEHPPLSKGDAGEAVTVLRPSGTGKFGKRKLSVVTSGEYIERGAKIRVTRVEGNRVVVRRG